MFDYAVAILVFTVIYGMIALGLNVQWGMTGLINLGQVAFMAVGAYTCSLLTLAGLPFASGLVTAAAAAAVMGVAVALITPRLREDYLAIVTLGFSELVRLVFLNEKWIANGPDGIGGIPRPGRELIGGENYELAFLGMAAAVTGLLLWLSLRIAHLPLGRVLRAIREDERVVEAVGKPSLAFKVRAFAIGAAFAGVGGAFFASYLTFISPAMFTAHVSVYVLAAVLLAARGSSYGTLAGIAVVAFLLEGTRLLKDYVPWVEGVELASLRLMALGAALMAVVVVRFRGK